jgi:hypothetical protein
MLRTQTLTKQIEKIQERLSSAVVAGDRGPPRARIEQELRPNGLD